MFGSGANVCEEKSLLAYWLRVAASGDKEPLQLGPNCA